MHSIKMSGPFHYGSRGNRHKGCLLSPTTLCRVSTKVRDLDLYWINERLSRKNHWVSATNCLFQNPKNYWLKRGFILFYSFCVFVLFALFNACCGRADDQSCSFGLCGGIGIFLPCLSRCLNADEYLLNGSRWMSDTSEPWKWTRLW